MSTRTQKHKDDKRLRRLIPCMLWLTLWLAACREDNPPPSSPPQRLPSADSGQHKAREPISSRRHTKEPARRKSVRNAGNQRLTSFNKAKRALATIYASRRQTFYCACRFNQQKRIIRSDCSYRPRKNSKRAKRVEWEHIVPASAFGQSFRVWRDGHPDCVDRRGKRFRGRNCARKVSILFRHMESDMHNLVPSIGELNGLRSNFSMAVLEENKGRFGNCPVKIAGRKIEPPTSVKGDVARAYLYMHQAYPGRGVVSRKNRKLYHSWQRLDPVDRWECERDRAIAKEQGNHNPFVLAQCKERKL